MMYILRSCWDPLFHFPILCIHFYHLGLVFGSCVSDFWPGDNDLILSKHLFVH